MVKYHEELTFSALLTLFRVWHIVAFRSGDRVRTVLFVQLASGMGGAARSLMLLASRLHHHGYRPLIVGQQDREGLWKETERRGLPYYPLYLSAWARSHLTWKDVLYLPNRANAWRRLAAICRRERVDIVHTNLEMCIDGAMTARLMGIPHVMHVRDEFADPHMARWWGGPGAATRMMAALSRRIIAISRAVAQPFEQCGFGFKTVVIPNAIEAPSHTPSSEDQAAARQTLGLPQNVPVVALIGQVIERKGHGEFIEAAHRIHARHPETCFLIAGGGLPDYIEHLKRQAGHLAETGVVRFLSHQADIWPIYAAADIIACPSWVEGFGRVPVEAMFAGRPVVAASVGGIVEIIEDGETGFLAPPHDPERLAEGLMRLIADPERARGMGRLGREKARKLYEPEIHVRRVAQVYDEILAVGS